LKNVCFIVGRAEVLAHNRKYREKYDLAVSRAVANLNILAELCIPFVEVGGLFAPHKSQKAMDEIAGAKNACALLGAEIVKTVPYSLGEAQAQMLIALIEKKEKTPAQYPRGFAKIKSKPL
jgi:16S rRNA (guanine527-N7)-methyltransferase